MRVFAAGTKFTASDVFNVSAPASHATNTFCGELDYAQKNVTVNAVSGQTYRFSEWPVSYNINEYVGVVSYKTGSLSVNAGNYGVVYNININNASGKRIKITPDWTVQGRTKASIIYSLNGGPWIVGSIITTGSCWYISLGDNSTANFKYILPGGNHGNFDVSFD